MTKVSSEKKERRLRVKKLMRESFILEAMFENGFDTMDVLTYGLEYFSYLLDKPKNF